MKIKILVIAYLTVGYLFSYAFANNYENYRYVLWEKQTINTDYIDSKFNFSNINIDINLCETKRLAKIGWVYKSKIRCYDWVYELNWNVYEDWTYKWWYCDNGYFLDDKFYNLWNCYNWIYELSWNVYTGWVYKWWYCDSWVYKNWIEKEIYISCRKENISIKDLYETNHNLYVISDSNFSKNKIYTDDNWGETYFNGKDYVFSNIDKITSEISFDGPWNISYIHENFLFYDRNTKKFLVKDVCENNDCSINNINNINNKQLSYTDFQDWINLVKNLQKNITTNDLLLNNNLFTFRNTFVSQLEYTAWDSLWNIRLWLAINIPYNTQPWDRFEYTYTIFLKDNNWINYDINTDKFVIANSWWQIGIYWYKYNNNWCIDNNNDWLCDLFDINEVFDGTVTSISMALVWTFNDVAVVRILERWTSVQKAGIFRFWVKLLIDWLMEDTLSSSKLSEINITVNPWEISPYNSYIKLITEVDQTKIISNDEIIHFKWNADILAFNMFLKDSYGNEITKDNVTVCYNNNVKIDNNDNNYLTECKDITYNGWYNFRMYFTNYWKYNNIYLKVDGKNIKTIWKNNNPLTINVISDSQAAAWWHYDTFNCTNRDIYYEYSCSYDIWLAWCYSSKKKILLNSNWDISYISSCWWIDCNLNSSFLFNSESYNSYGDNPADLVRPIYAMDNAWNITRKLFLLSHIDKTAPRISIDDSLFTNNKFIISVNDTMSNYPDDISFYPGWCKVNWKYEFTLENITIARDWVVVYEKNNYTWSLISPKWVFIFADNQDNIFYKEPGKYNISVTLSDRAWNTTSLNKEIIILPNTNFSTTNIDVEYSSYFADWYSVFTWWFELKDSYWNKIFWNYYDDYPFSTGAAMERLIKDLYIIYDWVIINELTNQKWWIKLLWYWFDENKWKYYFRFASYNNVLDGNVKLKLIVNSYDVMWNIDNNNTKEFDLSISPNFSSVFKEWKVYLPEWQEIWTHNWFTLVLSGGSAPAFNQDMPITFNVYTTWFNNPEWLKNVKIHANFWVVKWEDCSNSKDEGIRITASTGYENILEDLLSTWWYLLWNIWSNSIWQLQLKIRLERIWWNANTNIKLCSTGFVSYGLSYEDDYRTVIKKVNWISNVKVKYWWVFVEWLVSNTVKWLYEILRKSENNNLMSKWVQKQINETKIKVYTSIIRKVNKTVRWVSTKVTNIPGEINWIYYNDGDITINTAKVVGKSLIYSDGGNIIINWNIKKKWWIFTIVAKSKNGNGWYIYIAPNVTNIDAILVSEKGIFPYDLSRQSRYNMLEVVKWNKNTELNNQLLIYGMVISRWNTIGGSIRIEDSYVIPWWKKLPASTINFYKAAIYDLNYLRRYHYVFNQWAPACKEKSDSYDDNSCEKLDVSKYWTYPVVIKTDPEIKTKKPYGF